MAEKKKIPEIRFKGFSDDWEQSELGEIVKITMGQSPNGENYSDNPEYHILVQGNADMKNGKVVPRVWTKQVTKTADAEDLIMSVRAPVGEVGKTAYNVVIGRGVAAIKGNEFIFQSLKRMNENGYWNQFSAGSTFDSINSNDLSKAVVSTTKNEEQSKIGTYFKQLDTLITLHQRKYDKLVNVKKSMLEKMFPKNGATIPEIRFKGFTEAWEESKLGDVAKLGSSKRVHREDYVETGIPFFRGTEISKLGSSSILEDVLYISEEYFKDLKDKYGVPQIGDILLTAVGTLGNSFLVCDNLPFYFKDGNLIWLSDIKINPNYLNVYIGDGIGKKRVLESAAGSNQKALTMVNLQSVLIPAPSKEEQEKIGSYFKHLDDLLSLRQQELEKLKNIKKAMLEKMFV